MPPQWREPEENKPLLDRMVECGILKEWKGGPEWLHLVWNPDFHGGTGGREACQATGEILRRMYGGLLADPRDLRQMAAWSDHDAEPPGEDLRREGE